MAKNDSENAANDIKNQQTKTNSTYDQYNQQQMQGQQQAQKTVNQQGSQLYNQYMNASTTNPGGQDASNLRNIYGLPAAAATTAPATGAPTSTAGPVDRKALASSWTGSGGKTVADLQNWYAQNPNLAAQGVKIGGSKNDKLFFPDGTVVDAVVSAGLGGRGASWSESMAGQGGGGGGNAGPAGGVKVPDYYGGAESAANALTGRTGGVNAGLYDTMLNTGGYTGQQQNELGGDVAGLRELGRTGGLDDTSMANMRGNGVFNEYQKTGGWSPTDVANYRSRAASQLPAVYQSMADNMARRQNVQGGYSAGYGASSAAMARDAARQMNDSSVNSELGLHDQISQGRQWGATGGSAAEQNLQQLRTGNMFRGLEGANTYERAMIDAQNSNKLQTEGMAQSGRIAGAGDLTSIAGGRTNRDLGTAGLDLGYGQLGLGYDQLGLAKQNAAASASQFLINSKQQQQFTGLAGASGIHGQNSTNAQGMGNQFLTGMQGQNQNNTAANELRMKQALQPGFWTGLGNGLVGAAGAIAPFVA